MTTPSSPSRPRASNKSTKFHLPANAKAILLLVVTGALASIGRVEWVFQHYATPERFLRTTNAASFFGSRRRHSPRMVFFGEGHKDWFAPNASVSSRRTVESISYSYALLEQHDSNATNADLTRLYPVGDSKDFPGMERRKWPAHEFDPHCIPSADWQSGFYPVCNDIHAVADLRKALVTDELTLLSSKGFWRHAWRHTVGGLNGTDDGLSPDTTTTVWKTFKIDHNFEEKYYEDNRVDAVAMERLTGSPYVIGMYGFCGLTVLQEFAGRELAHVIDERKLNSTERLKLARKITEGVAHIHSIPADDGRIDQPTLVHNDINLANLVFTADDRPVLNDFNIAILIMKHNETGKACPFHSHFPNPQWKAPEEQVDNDEESHKKPPVVNDKIDIYALGNVLYRMIVGGSPWKRPEAKKLYPDEKVVVARLKRYNGTLPTVPDHILHKATEDPALYSLLDAMRQCYRFRPAERPAANQLMHFFDSALEKAIAFDAELAANRSAAAVLSATRNVTTHSPVASVSKTKTSSVLLGNATQESPAAVQTMMKMPVAMPNSMDVSLAEGLPFVSISAKQTDTTEPAVQTVRTELAFLTNETAVARRIITKDEKKEQSPDDGTTEKARKVLFGE